jgi:hypothetical protein
MVISFKEFSDTCTNPVVSIENVDVKSHFKNDIEMIKWLGIISTNKIELIKTRCGSYWAKQFFRPQNDLLILRAEGFFYYLRKEPFESNSYKQDVVIERHFDFIINQTNFSNENVALDSLQEIAKILKQNPLLKATIYGSTNNKAIKDLNTGTTVNGKNGTFKELLLERANAIAYILTNKLGVNPKQLVMEIGQVGNTNGTTVKISDKNK